METSTHPLHRAVTDATDATLAQWCGLLPELASGVLALAPEDALLMIAAEIERAGRVVDALRVCVAGVTADRSRRSYGSSGLAARRGCRNAIELLQRITRQSGAEVSRRVALAAVTAVRDGVTAPLPPVFPAVAYALRCGRLGTDSALAITRTLSKITDAAPELIEAAERELVQAATGTGSNQRPGEVPDHADDIRNQAEVWRGCLDPDGLRPAEERAMTGRMFDAGRERDGLYVGRYALMPEVHAALTRLFDATLSPRVTFGDTATPESNPHPDTAVDPDAGTGIDVDSGTEGVVPRDERTFGQRRHDVFAAIIGAAARSAEMPLLGGAPPTVLVAVDAHDLLEGRGAGWIDGIDAPVSLATVEQYLCNGGSQAVHVSTDGRILGLGSPQRCFTPQQRRAILLRDGGCIIPGCQVPAAWCEIHHVHPAAAGGPTHTDNGVLLCWAHHRTIDTSGWEIRMHAGTPHIKAPPWIDPSARWRPTRGSSTITTRRPRTILPAGSPTAVIRM